MEEVQSGEFWWVYFDFQLIMWHTKEDIPDRPRIGLDKFSGSSMHINIGQNYCPFLQVECRIKGLVGGMRPGYLVTIFFCLSIIRLILNESIWYYASKFGRGGRAESGVRVGIVEYAGPVFRASVGYSFLTPRIDILLPPVLISRFARVELPLFSCLMPNE